MDDVSTSLIHPSRERDDVPPSPPLRLWLSSVLLALAGGAHFGYHLVLTNPSELAFLSFLNSSSSLRGNSPTGEQLTSEWSLIASLLYLGAFFGALLIQPFSDRLGRKRATWLSTLGQGVSCTAAMASFFLSSPLLFSVSRVALGLFQAITVGVAPLYISECSPPSCRGIISLSTALAVQLSTVVGSVAAMPRFLGSSDSWWMLYGAEVVVFVVVLCLLPLLPESPSFLIMRGDRAGAEKSLYFYRGLEGKGLRDALQDLMKSSSSRSPMSLLSLLCHSSRGGAFTGAIVMFSMVASGIVVINGYAVSIFTRVGLSPSGAGWSNVAISALSVLGCVLSSLFVDRFGRRPLLLSTLPLLLLCNFFTVALMHYFEIYKDPLHGQLLIVVICVFMVVFSTGPAAVSFFISAELSSSESRGASMSLAAVVMAGCRCGILAFFPSLRSSIGSASAYGSLFIPPVLLSIIFLYFRLPETKGNQGQVCQVQKAEEAQKIKL